MSHNDKNEETQQVVLRTPPKISFIMGILVGITITALTAFGLNYSILKANVGDTSTANTNSNAKVAGAEDTAPTPSPTPSPAPTKADIQVTDDDHIRGNADAPITLVEYSDFECPYCFRVQPTLEQILDEYGDQVRLVYRHFPLSFHPQAQKAGEAAECAAEQGEFWAMHDKLYELNEQDGLNIDNYKAAAKELGLNSSQFDSCLDDGKYAQAVQDDFNQTSHDGVSGTPATFVNGTLISGAQPLSAFTAAIDSALEEAN